MKKETLLKHLKNQNLQLLDKIDEEIEDNIHLNCIDNLGYKYFLTPEAIRSQKTHAIVKGTNPYSIDNIKKFLELNNTKAELLSNTWDCGKSKLKMKCEKCGNIYEVRWYHLFGNRKFQCNKCAYETPYNKKQIEDAEKLCNKHGYHIIDGTYKNRKHFDMIDTNGYKYSDCSVHTLDTRTNKFQRFAYKNHYCYENIQHHITINNFPIIILPESTMNNIKLQCITCGDIYTIGWDRIVSSNFQSCRCLKCTNRKSNGEYLVEEYLKEKNIEYIYQKRFSWCKNKRKLPFDFYLPKYNTVIEVNGAQHYYESSYNHYNLSVQQERDEFKKQCCINNGVNYVDIPYWLITQSRIETYKKIIDNIIANVAN